jgi:hypothetical protein
MTSVIARPMVGSAIGAPSATTIAEGDHGEADVRASVRAWCSSAISAALSSLCPAARRMRAAMKLPGQ